MKISPLTHTLSKLFFVSLAAFLLVGLIILQTSVAQAANITVTSLADDGTGGCTLRDAIAAANTDSDVGDCTAGSGADTILFDPALTTSGDVTITLTSYEVGTGDGEAGPTAFNIFTDITILGAEGDNGITLARDETADEFRLFYVDGDDHDGALTLRDLTLRGGVARGGDGAMGGGGAAGFGGAILNRAATVLLERVTIVDNHAIGGIGVFGVGGGGGGLAGDGQDDGTPGGPAGQFGGGGAGTPAGIADPGGGGGSPNGDGGFGGGGGGGLAVGQLIGEGGYGATDGGNAQGGNGGAFGGAIFNWGEFSSTGDGPAVTTIINSTITDNSVEATGGASAFGSAIFGVHSRIVLSHTTVVSNTHVGDVTDGMIFMIGNATSGSTVLMIENSIIASTIGADSALRTEQYIGGRPIIRSSSGNLIDTAEIDETSGQTLTDIAIQGSPLLFPLADNGGSTPTLDVMFESPARNGADQTKCASEDQRGVARPTDGACEIGSVERDGTPALSIEKLVDNAEPDPNDRLTFTLVVTNIGDGDATMPTTVSDLLPPELVFVPNSVTIAPSGTAGTPPNVATIPTIDMGERVTVTFQTDALFDPIDRGKVITNTATASNPDAPSIASDSIPLTLSIPGTLVSRIGNTTEIDIDDLGAMVITLSRSDDDANIVVHDPDHPVIALEGATQIDNNTATIPFVTTPRQTFNILGSLGDDTLIFDHTNGLAIPNLSNVSYDGGAEETADGDSFRSIGQNNTSSHSYTFIDDSSGSIEYGGTTIDYTGLEPVYVDTRTGSLTLTLADSADLATISDLGGFMARIDGATLEMTDFGLPLGSAAMLVELGDGDDTLVMDSLVLDGKTRLTLDGEEGDDEILWQMGRSSADTERIRVRSADFTFDPSVSHSVILRGTGQGDTYDQIRMTDANTITLNVPLDLSLGNGFVPVLDDTFTIIEMEDIAGTVNGIFDGYPEGHTFLVDDVPFRITYQGGDGNDVVLFVPNLAEIDFSIEDASVVEGDSDTTALDFIVRRTTNDLAATVDFVTSDGLAEASSDYTAVTTTVSFAAGGSLTQTVTISVTGEQIVEADETLQATISNPSFGNIITGTATGTIENDDTTRINFGGTVSGIESFNGGNRTYHYFVTSSRPVQGGFSIDFSTNDATATAGTDYEDNDDTLIFAGTQGEQQNFQVIVINDDVVEPNEDFVLRLDGPFSTTLGANFIFSRKVLTATIDDEDIATVTLSGDVSQPEGDAGAAIYNLTATLNKGVTGGFDVTYATADDSAVSGDDYVASNGTLSFAGDVGESKTISVTLNGDTIVEPDETFSVSLGAFSNTVVTSALRTGDSPQTFTIENDDVATLTVSDAPAVMELDSGTQLVTVTVTLSGTVAGGTSVKYASVSGSASITDFNGFGGQTLAFDGNDGETQTISVEILGDTKVEPDESFTIEIREPTNGVTITKAAGLISILNDDSTTVMIAGGVSADEGDLINGTTPFDFTVSLADRIQGGIDIAYATQDGTATAGSDYDAVDSTVNIPEFGSLSQTISVDVNGDNDVEADETFEVVLGALTFDSGIDPNDITIIVTNAIGTILNDDGVTFAVSDAAVVEGNSGTATMVFTVTAEGSIVNSVSVDYMTQDGTATTADGDYDADSDTLTFNSAGSQTVAITVNGDTAIENDETFSLLLDNVQSGLNQTLIVDDEGIGTITDDDGVPTAITLTQQAARLVTVWQLVLTLMLTGTTFAAWRKRH